MSFRLGKVRTASLWDDSMAKMVLRSWRETEGSASKTSVTRTSANTSARSAGL